MGMTPTRKKGRHEKRYIIYDERAEYDEDEAAVLVSANTLDEARRDAKDFPGSIIFEYDLIDGVAVNGRRVY